MNERKLSLSEKTLVEEFESDLRHKLCLQNDKDLLFSDLTGLYIDIIFEISKVDISKTVIIYDYAKLLEQEIQLYSGTEAYIVGLESKGKPENEIFNAYLNRVREAKNEIWLDTLIDESFNRPLA